MKKYIKYAFSRTLPVLFGYIFLGIAFGIVLQQAGFNFIWAFCISLFLYAGSMQFVLVPLLASAASPLTVAVTTLFVNSRHVFYGLSFIESFKKMKTQLYMIFSLSDETYSVLCSCKNEDPGRKEPTSPGFSSTCLTKATGSSVLSSALCLVRYCPLTLPVLIFP